MFLNSKDDEEINEIYQHKKSNISGPGDKPLSPVLSSLNRRRVHLKRGTVKPRVKLDEKYQKSDPEQDLLDTPTQQFNNESFTLSQTENLVSRLEELEEIERKRTVVYNIFSNIKQNDSCFKRPASPSRAAISNKNNFCVKLNKTEYVNTTAEVENILEPTYILPPLDTDIVKGKSFFSTAGGKTVMPTEGAIKKYCKLFDDILTPNESCETRNSKFSFLSKIKTSNIEESDLVNETNIKKDFSSTQQICDFGISDTQILCAVNKVLDNIEEQKSSSCLGFTKTEIKNSKQYYQCMYKRLFDGSSLSNQQEYNELESPPCKKLKFEINDQPKESNNEQFNKIKLKMFDEMIESNKNVISAPVRTFSNSVNRNIVSNKITGDNTVSKESFSNDLVSFGFTSASGKNIKVSEVAAKKVSNIFDDLCDYKMKTSELNYSAETSKKLQQINKKKLDLFEEMIQSNNLNALNAPKTPFFNFDNMNRVETINVNVSAKTIIKETPPILNSLYKSEVSEKGEKYRGFATALGKNLVNSNAADKKAGSIFDDLFDTSNKQIFNPNSNMKSNLNYSSVSSKLRDVNKSKLNLFDEMIERNNLHALNVPKAPFSNPVDLHLHKIETLKTNATTIAKSVTLGDDINKKDNFISYGFASASGKNIKISEAASKKASTVFDDIFDGKDVNIENNIFKKQQNSKQYTPLRTTLPTLKLNKPETSTLSTLKNTEVVEENDYTPVKLNKHDTSINRSKRKLGMSFCKQIPTSDTKLKRARLIFDEDLTGISPIKPHGNLPTSSDFQCNYSSTPVKSDNNAKRTSVFVCPPQINETYRTNKCTCDSTSSNLKVVLDSTTKGDAADWVNKLENECRELEDRLRILQSRQKSLNEINEQSLSVDRKPREGFLYRRKKSEKKTSLSEFVNMEEVTINYLNDISPNIAESVHFVERSSSLYTKDEATVIPNLKNLVGLTEIEFAFKNMPGVEPSLIPNGWIKNHFKWVVWKLASYERTFPACFEQCFSVENVIQQLKYRYDREIDKAERPALRKIYEKDDVPQKRMVLCVSDIKQVNERHELELTDGWYSIRTVIDDLLCNQIHNGKIKVGTKLITFGALLFNCDGCHPLEATDLIYLKINYNATRRARWYARLGYQNFPGPFPIQIHSVHPNGGLIGSVNICIVRVYPPKYLERIGNQTTCRNKRAEERRAQTWENERRKKIEHIQEELKREFMNCYKNEIKNVSRINNVDIAEINSPKELLHILENSNDPYSIEHRLTSTQKTSILEYKRKKEQEIQNEINAKLQKEIEKLKMTKRDVRCTLKLLVTDVNGAADRPFAFSVWHPNESHLQMLKEGMSFVVENILPQKNGDLSSNNKTTFKPLSSRIEIDNIYIRKVTEIEHLINFRYSFREFDTIGVVVTTTIQENSQEIWLSDISGRLLLIEVYEGPSTCLLVDNAKRGQPISVCNLIYKYCKEIFAHAVANHSTVFSSYSQFKHLQDGLDLVKSQLPKNVNELLNDCDNRIEIYKTNRQRSIMNGSNFNENDDDTLLSTRLSTTDVALSLIDIESFK